jgi:hypothetical protein
MTKITGHEPITPTYQEGWTNQGTNCFTIRHQFAMAALTGYISAGSTGMPNISELVKLAVDTADALIDELNKD